LGKGWTVLKLSEIISLDLLQEIQDRFASATGFAAITVDFQGKPVLKYSNFSRFCTKLREDEFFYNYCCQSDAHSALEAVRKGSLCIHRCHAGLIDFSVPIIVEGEYVASVMCGQVKADDDTGLKTRLLEQSDDLFTVHPELRELHGEIPVLPVRRIKDTANLLSSIVDFVVDQFYARRQSARLLEEGRRQEELRRRIDELEMTMTHSRAAPHFLFNALSAAGRQAHMEGARKAEDIIYAIADMLRYSMRSAEPLVTIGQEMQNVRNYMFVQRARFGELISFEADVDAGISEYLAPAMSVQTLVENAVRHGLEKKDNLGMLKVRGWRSDGRICFEISDDGAGMTKDRMKFINDADRLAASPQELSGSGILSLYRKLKYFYGDDCKLRFAENPDGGVIVRMEFSMRKNVHDGGMEQAG
jgi:ligand-binding sensor protein